MPRLLKSGPRPLLGRACTALTVTAALAWSGALAQEQVKDLPRTVKKAQRALKTKRATYVITTEPKEFDSDEAETGAFAAAKKKAEFPGESFVGTDRKAAKLTPSSAPVEDITDVKDLVDSLPEKATMAKKKISTSVGSDRVAEEQRNVRLRCFLYAASKEADNDFHMILGRAPGLPKVFMTMELSGLPPSSSPSFDALKGARDSFTAFFASHGQDHRPGTNYDFYNPPIPVEVEGSTFFDQTHVTGTPPGPRSLRPMMPVIWEVHPVTKITFEP